MFNPVEKVNCQYGAPMGRANDTGNAPSKMGGYLVFTGKLYCRKIRLDSGGYDQGGAYWGLRMNGESLYCVYSACGTVRRYIDAKSRKSAIFKSGFLSKNFVRGK